MKVPPTIKFVYHGKLQPWVGGKDLILHTIGAIGVDGALYSAMEFHGDAISSLPMDGRFTMSNMAIEAGGKAGIFPVDAITEAYVAAHPPKSGPRPILRYTTDSDEDFARIVEFDAGKIEPSVAFPHKPSNTRPISQVGTIDINQVVIGSCTNGRLSDLIVAAGILRGRKVHPNVVCIVIPATQRIYTEAMEMGLLQYICRFRGGCQHSHVRSLPWRIHGSAGSRREVRLHHQPQLRRAHGQQAIRTLPCRSRGRSRKRHRRTHRRT